MTEATVNSPRAAGDPTSLGRSNLNSVFGGGVGRISLIAFAVVLVAMFAYGGYKMFFSRPSLPASASGAPVSTPRAGVHDPMSPVSLEEGGRRAQLNSEVADAATNRGISYVAAPVVMDKRYDVTSDQPVGMTTVADRQPATEMAAAPSPQVGGNGGQGNQQQQQPNPQNQAQLQAEQEMRKAIMEQVGAVMRGSQGGGNQQRSGFSTFYSAPPARPTAEARAQNGTQEATYQEPTQNTGSATATTAGNAPAPAPAGRQQGEPLLKSGDTCYATLDNGINSDDTLIVLATLHSCENQNPQLKAGGKLIGRVEKTQQQVRVAFNKMTLPGRRGGSVPIDAIAVTEDEARSGVGADVDHHYLSRYASLGLASLLTGYGRAASIQTGTAVVTAGSTIVTTPPIDPSRRNLIALGEIGTAFGNEVRRDFARPTTITAPRNMGIGVIFVNDVFLNK